MKWSTNSAWLEQGPESDVVLSCRARLARNIAGFPFVARASDNQRAEIFNLSRQVLRQLDLGQDLLWFDLREAAANELMLLLVERHLISRHHAEMDLPRAVAITPDERVSIMVNEEDHLRMQFLAPGLQFEHALLEINRIDDKVESRLDFAFSSRWGYLTACPTNVGTGIRFSTMLHLPGLKLAKDIDRVRRAAKDMHLAVRGYYGEGSDSAGDFYQISNQITLGASEADILDAFSAKILPQIIAYERKAREVLVSKRSTYLDDRIFRAVGVLQSARIIDVKEAMKLLSRIRLGVCLGRLPDFELATINQLFLRIQPAHLRMMSPTPLRDEELSIARAAFIRKTLG
ncbi:MAG: protein arginine kinase [Phycisphaerales bacterium]|nr:protein arginine kinase [Phycisphaerales bacterium]